jgi:hypothetical protein
MAEPHDDDDVVSLKETILTCLYVVTRFGDLGGLCYLVGPAVPAFPASKNMHDLT